MAVYNIAKICNERKIKLIHISTDYVFDGNGKVPYLETDNPNPISIYGKTKLDGELAIIKINLKNSIIIRTSWVYSNFGNNFLKTMLRHAKTNMELNIICDQFGSPTYAKNLANVMLEILPNINNTSPEIFNYSNKGFCSWYEFAEAIFKYSGSNIILNPIQSYYSIALRPFFSVLDKTKIEKSISLFSLERGQKLYNELNHLNEKVNNIELEKTVLAGGYCSGCGVCTATSNSPFKMKMTKMVIVTHSTNYSSFR